MPGRTFKLEIASGKVIDAAVHTYAGLTFIELEPALTTYSDATPLFLLRSMLTRLQEAANVEEMFSIAVGQLRALIGFDRDEPASRPAALMALLVTGGTAILMLVGVIMLWIQSGSTSINELVAQADDTVAFSTAIWLIAIAALAKSAQMPLHFWLPRAMVAPTPVSSYLHSAAMVAAGVFLLERLLPLVHRAALLPQALLLIGLCSIVLGGILALGRDDMKRVLAYSTIGQYGYVVVLLGLSCGALAATGHRFIGACERGSDLGPGHAGSLHRHPMCSPCCPHRARPRS